jgi:hypothetical protein
MIGILSDAADWELAKKIAGSRIVAISAFFPFLGYIILLNADFVGYFRLYFDLNDQTGASTLARIEEIYFSLIWISFGAILFQLFCPNEVKRFSSSFEMIESEMAITGPIRLERIKTEVTEYDGKVWISKRLGKEVSLIKDADVSDRTASGDGVFGYASGNPSRADYLSTVGNSAIELLGVFYDCKRQSRPLVRGGILIIIGVGYIKMSLPSIKVFLHLLTL